MTSRFQRGFSIVELLVVIGIIGILSSVVLSQVNQARTRAKIAKAQLEVRQIRNAVTMLQNDTDEWPDHKTIDDIQQGASGNELWDLSVPEAGLTSTDGNFNGWQGPYMESMPKDPWGNDYFFDTDYDIDQDPAQEDWVVVIGSFGPNGVGQNVYDSDNVFNVVTWEED